MAAAVDIGIVRAWAPDFDDLASLSRLPSARICTWALTMAVFSVRKYKIWLQSLTWAVASMPGQCIAVRVRFARKAWLVEPG